MKNDAPTPNQIPLADEEKAIVISFLSRMARYRELFNEVQAGLDAAAGLVAKAHKIGLDKYALSNDGAAFVLRQEAPAAVPAA